MPAANQDASRNSWPVRTRSAHAGADPLRVGEQHPRPDGQQVGEQLQLAADQRRDQRLHALGRDALGEVSSSSRSGAAVGSRCSAGQRRGPLPHRPVSSSSRQPGATSSLDRLDRALVGDGERAQLADLVAPELDAHRVLGGRREDVDDAAAHGELAARGDHLDAGVGQLDQPLQQRLEVVRRRRRRSETGSSAPSPGATGWIRLRAAATTTRGARARAASRRKIVSRRPTVSGRGESRSCGSVSQVGSTTTGRPPGRGRRRVGDTEQVGDGGREVLGLPVGGGDGEDGAAASADPLSPAVRNGRSAAGPSTRRAGVSAVRGSAARAASTAARRPGSDRAEVSRPDSVATAARTPREWRR